MVIPKGKFKTECKQYLSQTSDSFTCTAYTLLSEQGQNHITPNLSEAYFLCSQLTDTCLFLPNFSPNITVLLYCPFSVLGQRDFWASLFYNPRGLKWKGFLLTEVKDSQFPNVAHNTCLERTPINTIYGKTNWGEFIWLTVWSSFTGRGTQKCVPMVLLKCSKTYLKYAAFIQYITV